MQLGFVSAIFGDLALEDVLKFAAGEGYDCVELVCWPDEGDFAGVCHLHAEGFTQAAADGVHALCEKHGTKISALGYYPNHLSADGQEARMAREHLCRVVDAAVLLGMGNVNTFIGADPAQPMHVNFEQFTKVWPELVQYAQDRDIYLGIENCPMLFAEHNWPSGANLARSPEIWRRMFQTIRSDHFGLNLDPSHLVWQMIDTIEPIHEFREKIFHTHAKDTRIEHRLLQQRGILSLDWHTAKIPGLGEIDWGRWISALTDIGYQGAVCVEIEDKAFYGSLADRQRALRISRNVLRPLIG